MTANSEWEEVVQTTRCLSQREQAMNCADLMKRVFDLKKKQLMREIFYGGMYDIFGKCLAWVWTIEIYQKRGLLLGPRRGAGHRWSLRRA